MYEHHFLQRVHALPSLTVSDILSGHHRDKKEVQVSYTSHKDFEVQAKKLKIMFDFRVSPYSDVFPPTVSSPVSPS